MFTIFKLFMMPAVDSPETFSTQVPVFTESTASEQNMENILTMFDACNETAQTMIHMNSEYLATTERLSDDIGIMADRIGLMADKIEETEILQSTNFLALQSNVSKPVSPLTNSTVITIMTSEIVSSVTLPTLPVDNSISSADFVASLFPAAAGSNAAQVASMVVSFSETMNSMININTEYLNTTFKLGNDIGDMVVRIAQMSDKIVDTMVIQGAVLEASLNHTTYSTGTGSTSTPQTVVQNITAPHVESSLTSTATSTATTIIDMTSSFSSMMGGVVGTATSTNNSVHGIVEMFTAANLVIREMITLNTQFLTTVLSLSDEIGFMADRIGDMADQIVAIQKDLSPLYLSSHDVSGNVDTTEAVLIATNGTIHATTEGVNIFLDSIDAVAESSSLTMPVDMATIGEMTSLFVSILKGLATADMGAVNMDEVTAMFVTANETMQLMMGMNDQYMDAILRLSDDIGIMADRIGVMADRIVETQEIQSENFLATYYDALNMMLIGDANINQLNGGVGTDTLDGKAGADIMVGGTGNDTYYVDNAQDIITETSTSSSEIDTVNSTVSYILAANVENLVLSGTAAINGMGNSLGNTLVGNSGANILNGSAGNDTIDGKTGADTILGGTGNDTLTGGAGNDVFVFNTALNSLSNRDTIIDFESGFDKIQLNKTIFTKLTSTGVLNTDNFVATALGVPRDFNDYIIYNTITGALYYDADGIGFFAMPIQIAVVGMSSHPAITAADFTVI
jgi:Ca2+-binding RTX toxin-like protein